MIKGLMFFSAKLSKSLEMLDDIYHVSLTKRGKMLQLLTVNQKLNKQQFVTSKVIGLN